MSTTQRNPRQYRRPKQPKPTAADALSILRAVHTVTDRIRTGWSNVGKKNRMADHFARVLTVKNLMAEFAYEHLSIIETSDFKDHGYQMFRKTLPDDLQNVMTAWETQKLFHDVVCPHTVHHAQQVIRNRVFHCSRGNSEVVHGRTQWKSHRTYGTLATLLNALRFRPTPQSDTEIPVKWSATWKNYVEKFGRDRLCALLDSHHLNVSQRIHPVNYTTGSHIKSAQFNKASKNPTWHSHWFKKESCTRYQNWYLFKTPNSETALPLAINPTYHNKPYDLTKEHWVTLNRRGEIDISLSYDRTDVLTVPSVAVGLDLNVASNLFATSHGWMVQMEEDWLKKHESKLASLEQKGYRNLDDADKLVLKRITKHRESDLRNTIQQTLIRLKNDGVTDVVLESLSITLGGGLSRRMHKVLRLLRFGTIRTWMREQAHKLGMRIHDFPSAYSSQACACGNVDAKNRRGHVFTCTQCGESGHADTHAAQNLLRLFEQARDVLLQYGFLSINAFGEYVATSKARLQYSSIRDYYTRKTGESHIQGGKLVIVHHPSQRGVGNPCPLICVPH